jgi:hypothetical protein
VAALLDAYAHETEPPVPAVAEKSLLWTAKLARTLAAEFMVAVVGEVVAVEQIPAVHAHDENTYPPSGVAVMEICVPRA